MCSHWHLAFVLQGLTVKEMEELRDDIKMHLDMDRTTQTHIDYWEVLSFFSFCAHVLSGVIFVPQNHIYVHARKYAHQAIIAISILTFTSFLPLITCFYYD